MWDTFKHNSRWFWLINLIVWVIIATYSWLTGDYTAARLSTVIVYIILAVLTDII